MKIDVLKLDSWEETPITVQFMDGEIVSYCNHAGAQWQDVSYEVLEFDEGYGNYLPEEVSEEGYVCDKENCRAFSRDGEEWYE